VCGKKAQQQQQQQQQQQRNRQTRVQIKICKTERPTERTESKISGSRQETHVNMYINIRSDQVGRVGDCGWAREENIFGRMTIETLVGKKKLLVW
jgi:hypothetical protein